MTVVAFTANVRIVVMATMTPVVSAMGAQVISPRPKTKSEVNVSMAAVAEGDGRPMPAVVSIGAGMMTRVIVQVNIMAGMSRGTPMAGQ